MSLAAICQVYKSLRKEGMYIYVDKREGLTRVPEALVALLGKHKAVMTLLIRPEQAIAGVSAERVLQQIIEKGFYLQMPPLPDEEMAQLAEKNSKLSRG